MIDENDKNKFESEHSTIKMLKEKIKSLQSKYSHLIKELDDI